MIGGKSQQKRQKLQETRIAENGSNYARKKVHYLGNLRDDVITLIQNFDL